jgi:putative transposase
MPKKTFTPEQIVGKLRQIEVLVSQGKTVPVACREAGIVDQTYYRWRKEYGGLQLEQAKKLKELQKENAQLRRALADLTVEKQILKDIAQGNL